MSNHYEALRAAHQDTKLLISPSARRRSLAQLKGPGEIVAAARLILRDGGYQQGLPEADKRWMAPTMEAWVIAARTLERWCKASGRHCIFNHMGGE